MELKDSWRIGKAAIQVTRSIGDADVKVDGLVATPEVRRVKARAPSLLGAATRTGSAHGACTTSRWCGAGGVGHLTKRSEAFTHAQVFTHELTPEDEFLVVACDGLWDTLSNDKVVTIIQDTVKHPAMVAQRLATEAINAGSGDNISVIVVFLQPSQQTVERVY